MFGPNSFFQILFMQLESTQFKAPDCSKNGKWIKMDLRRSSPGRFISQNRTVRHETAIMAK
jgi:hypothetical protein